MRTLRAPALASTHWADNLTRFHAAFATEGGGRDIPIAVTEFKLASSQDEDDRYLLTRAVDALFSQYFVFPLWSAFGNDLLPATS